MGADTDSARLCIEKVCALANAEVVAALLDEERTGFRRRVKNLRRNVRKEGWQYIPRRVLKFLRALTDRLVECSVVSSDSVHQVLAASFPDRCFSLGELGQKYNFEVLEVGNLNESRAIAALKAADADLGIVLGTRILKEQIFSVPRLGCVNLHKGMVPNYRGMPPAFWELYDGAAKAGVTVHYVNKGLDTGDVVEMAEVPILPTDTPDTLCEKLHEEGARTLARAVDAIATGTAVARKQGRPDLKARSAPTAAEVWELQKRLPHWRQRSDARAITINIYLLLVYWSGLYFLMRMCHRGLRARGCILLYHRVNDYSKDILTVDTRTFAAQLIAMRRRYPSTTTSDMVDRIGHGGKIKPTSIVIHFDDCYRDTVLNGMPILKTLGYTPTFFVSSGFLNTDRAFAHDCDSYPFRFPNLRTDDVHAWSGAGFELGAHTVNHVDLGTCSVAEAKCEVTESRLQLDAVRTANGKSHSQPAEGSVRFMSYPFGQPQNIRPEVVMLVRDAGYSALFSAYGGSVGPKTELFNIPRMGVSGETRPLYLLLEIEGLAPRQVLSAFRRRAGVSG